MGFADAIRTCLNKYVTISGRARRAEYWWWILFIVLGSIGATVIDAVLFGVDPEEGNGLLAILFSLGTLLPTICVGGRRLHDHDMSAWWLLLGLIPLIGGLVLIVLFIMKGTEGSNRFGPDPLRA